MKPHEPRVELAAIALHLTREKKEGLPSWVDFLRDHEGKGDSMRQLDALYKRKVRADKKKSPWTEAAGFPEGAWANRGRSKHQVAQRKRIRKKRVKTARKWEREERTGFLWPDLPRRGGQAPEQAQGEEDECAAAS